MSNENFEVIFAGKLVAGAQLDQVKVKVAAIFKTDVAKIEHLFSGNPVVIKKGIDQAMAQKYQAALQAAGAVCEIRNPAQAAPVAAPAAAPRPPAAPAGKAVTGHAPPAPQTVPLQVSGEQIADLQVSIAPVGSDMNQQKQAANFKEPDLSGLSMAPPGSDLSTGKKAVPPPPPDTGDLAIVKN